MIVETLEARTGFDRRTKCPLCGSDRWQPSRWNPNSTIRRCRNCDLSYQVDPLDPLVTRERTAAELAAIDASRVRLFEHLIAKLGSPGPDDLLVDLGASSGSFVELASDAGWKAVGIEVGRSLAETARDLGRCVIVGNAESIPVQTRTASAVTLWDALDQFDVPRTAIAEAARILSPGGTLWLRVRNGAVHELIHSQRWVSRKLSILHNNLYSPRCLRKALAAAGFENVRVVVSPTSRGDPYASTKGVGPLGLRLTKTAWNYAALLVALVSAGTLVISPSIAVFARRADSSPGRHARR